jgi:Concanavalin A-like lectin/glucanases superfamily
MPSTTPKNIYTIKNRRATFVSNVVRIANLETESKVFNPLSNPAIIQSVIIQREATQFVGMSGVGDKRGYATSAPSSVDEEGLATVVAYATFDDVGGNATPVLLDSGGAVDLSFTGASFTALSFGSAYLIPEFKIPLYDQKGRTAYYRGHVSYLAWNPYLAPEVSHTKQFMAGHSVELNVPGSVTDDKRSYWYYDSNSNFNVSASISVSLWFYPTDVSQIASETWRTLLYRRIDASNSFAILIKPADSKLYVFVTEAGATTKLASSATVTLNAWNLIIFTYNPTTNALVIYLNNSTSSTTPADTYTPPYTTDANMYGGGLPLLADKRFTGYMDNFVFWSAKILTGTEAGNMWNRGTIV